MFFPRTFITILVVATVQLLDCSSFPKTGAESSWIQIRGSATADFFPRLERFKSTGGLTCPRVFSMRGGGRDRHHEEEQDLVGSIRAMGSELREGRKEDLKGLRLDLKLRGKIAAIRKEDHFHRPSTFDRSTLPLGSTFASIDDLDEMEANYIAQILRILKEVSPDFSQAGRSSRILFNPVDAGSDGWEDWAVCNATLEGVDGEAAHFVVLMHGRLQTVVWLQHVSTGSFFFAPARSKHVHLCYRWGDVEDLGSSDFALGSELVDDLRQEADTGHPAEVEGIEVGSEVEFGCWRLSVQPSGRILARNIGLDSEWRPGVELHLREHGFVFVTTNGAAVVVDEGDAPYRIDQYDLQRLRLSRKLGFVPKAPGRAVQGTGDQTSAGGNEQDRTIADPADTSSLLSTVSGTEAHSAVEDTSSMSWCPSSAGLAGYNVTEIENGNFPPIAQDWIPDDWWSD